MQGILGSRLERRGVGSGNKERLSQAMQRVIDKRIGARDSLTHRFAKHPIQGAGEMCEVID
ncbi:hypothetical protein XF14_14780 [Burkholderia gladioli]|nr:hypothetical protein XF14_14780 [Burkholderia gladioli]